MEISTLGNNINTYMLKENLTMQQLRKKAHIGYTTLYDILHGKTQNLSSKTIEKLANALNCTPNELLGIETIEYDVSDLQETLSLILESDELELDGTLLSSDEKENLKSFFTLAIKLIQLKRNNSSDNNINFFDSIEKDELLTLLTLSTELILSKANK